jgi:glycosyltransferase involved in cell wall biosynthesis
MIRVGFLFLFSDQGWLGGLNYFRNLLTAVMAQPDRQVEPVIFTRPGEVPLAGAPYAGIERVESPLLARRNSAWWTRKLLHYTAGRDVLLERLVAQARVEVLSHSGYIGSGSRIPTLGWIPDFQHRRLPQFFSEREIVRRDREYGRIAKLCTRVLLSSEDAARDFREFVPEFASKVTVVRFASTADLSATRVDRSHLFDRYAIDRPYFFLPNQFWAHKNHRIVVEALARMPKGDTAPLVLATGNPVDHRQPGYFEALMAYVRACGVMNLFRCLGVVPYPDLVGLMAESIAVINPSRFEGWSTTVEEAKALGKKMILSDIPVHHEQAECGAEFFAPDDADGLARILLRQLAESDGSASAPITADIAAARRNRRIRDFALAYESAVRACLAEHI